MIQVVLERKGREACWCVLSVICAVGCDGAKASGARGDTGPTVDIAAQTVESGFAGGVLRRSSDVGAFAIRRFPVTVGEYRKCVNAGPCSEPEQGACVERPGDAIVRRPNFKEPDVADDVAVTCVGLDQARNYCKWTGGTLPTLEQWLLAARGSGPQLYAWGAAPPTCEQHGLAPGEIAKPCERAPSDIGRVALHPKGASPFGLQDVLLASGELLEPSGEDLFSACHASQQGGDGDAGSRAVAAPSEKDACAVYGFAPGSIDSVRRLTPKEASPLPYGFRCVGGGAS